MDNTKRKSEFTEKELAQIAEVMKEAGDMIFL